MNSYDCCLQGKGVIANPNKITVEGNAEARLLFENAIELDPKSSSAYAELAYLYVRESQNGWSADRTASLTKAEDIANKALAISDDVDSHWSLASVYWNQGEFDKSLSEYDTARRLSSNNPDVGADIAADMAEALIYGGDPDRAITQIKEAMLRTSKIPYWHWWNLGRACYMAKRYQDALDDIAKIAEPPNDTLLVTAASKAQLGNLDGAKSDMAKFSQNDPNWTLAKSVAYHYRNDSDRQHWLDGLRKAGLK